MFKSGELHGVQPEILTSIIDGFKARDDPDLLRKATPEEMDDFRILLQARVL